MARGSSSLCAHVVASLLVSLASPSGAGVARGTLAPSAASALRSVLQVTVLASATKVLGLVVGITVRSSEVRTQVSLPR